MAEIILTSLQNPVVKEVTALQDKKNRTASGLIILEGEKSIAGALEAGLKLESIFYENEKYASQFPAAVKYKVNEKILAKISSTSSPAPVLAIIKRPVPNAQSLQKLKRLIVLENIKDAGNLGTIIRTAAAFELDGIILAGDCVDAFDPKTIRASVGTIFKIPIATAGDFAVFKKSHTFISTVVDGGDDVKGLETFEFPEKFLVFFGSEAQGLSPTLQDLVDEKITIKMAKNVESLNLSVSAGIILHKIFN